MVECVYLVGFRFSVVTADTGSLEVMPKTNGFCTRVHPFTVMEQLVLSWLKMHHYSMYMNLKQNVHSK